MSIRPFVIGGCGRSGTGFTSTLLNAAGIVTGHENVLLWERRAWGDFAGDVSGMSILYLRELVGEATLVHLVRHPLEVARSYSGLRTFFDDMKDPVQQTFLARLLDYDRAPFDLVNPHDRFGAYWIRTNISFEMHGTLRVRVEDLRDAGVVENLLEEIGHPRSRSTIIDAISRVGERVNGGARDESMTLESFSPGVRAMLSDMAERYGYHL